MSLNCEYKYISAIAQLRASSHTLAIEKGRHERPKRPVEQRLCKTCNVIENEEHFVTNCAINEYERQILYEKITEFDHNFINLSSKEKFIYLLCYDNESVLTWFGKFLRKSFTKRNIDSS